MATAQRSVEIAIARDRLFDIVEDYQKYPEFIPEMKRVSVLRKAEGSQEVEFELELDVIGMKKRIRYTLAFTEQRPEKVSWRLVTGDFMKGNVGSWVFREAGENRTEATYTIDLSLGALVPRAVSNFLAEQSLPRLLGQVKARAESLAGKP